MKNPLKRIGVSIIFTRHFQTFYNYGMYEWSGKKEVNKQDITTFIILPLLLSILIVFLDVNFVKNFSELIVTSLSIFIGLLFSLLTLIFDLAKKEKEKIALIKANNGTPTKKEKASFVLIKEMFINISYAILLSILSIVCVFITEFRPKYIISYVCTLENQDTIKVYCLFLANLFVVFLLIQFLLTLLMVLRRFFIVFNYQIEIENHTDTTNETPKPNG